ncbi:sulfite exporter TauE/SafE family protein [Dechloromonas sp. ZY10]|uniref:sulfite exporter TauE/SafE family protein n=1 Tax=Dechloromonas aquae TaxID=2664436 RepID=UPI003529CBDF
MDFVLSLSGTWPLLLMALPLGAALGFLGGLFGIGSGIVAIPMLVAGFGMSQPQAQGTALVLMVPNLLLGWHRYQQRHPLPWRAVLPMMISASLTTWLLAHFANTLDPRWLRGIFCIFLSLLAINLLRRRHRPPVSEKPLDHRLIPLVGVLGGCSMGLLGIGGGLLASPLLSGWLGQRQTTAQGLSLALVAPSSLVALLAYADAGRVDWSLGLPLAAGGILTVSAGVALAHRLPERRLRTAFAVMLLIAALWLWNGTA